MHIRKAQRKQAKIKLALQGPAGSGKTYGAILLGQGLGKDLTKTCIIDTENGSADLYAHLGGYSVINLNPPYTPEKYIKALSTVHQAGFEVVVLDSISHCWEYLLDYHSNLTGNSFTNWSKVTPRQTAFIQAILTTPLHVIATLRTKQEYVLSQKGEGKYVPEKMGLKAIQRDGTDYEFTTVFDLDIKHNASCSKDRTGMFMDQPACRIDSTTGEKILRWCNEGSDLEEVIQRIGRTTSLKELTGLYKAHIGCFPALREHFSEQKGKIIDEQRKDHKTSENNLQRSRYL